MGRLTRNPGEEFVREAQAGVYQGPQYPEASSEGWEVPIIETTDDVTACIRSTHPWALPTPSPASRTRKA
eukprot:11331507-Alexandrium_andersonii.AAC.1